MSTLGLYLIQALVHESAAGMKRPRTLPLERLSMNMLWEVGHTS